VQVAEDGSLSFFGINPYTRKWGRILTHGGKLLENISQGTSRDVLVAGMINAACSGGRVVLHIHDEPILEQPIGDGWTVERLIERMTHGLAPANADWTHGLPLAADGFETDFYYKAA
jgi:DNA polymerase